MKKLTFLSILSILLVFNVQGQGNPNYDGGFKIKFDDEGQKYIRFLAWTQFQAVMDDAPAPTESLINMKLRRARFLAYGQLLDNFLVVTHFGLNSLDANNMSPTGQSAGAQLFMHDAWVQYSVHKNHVIGGGLHYWNGLSRLNAQSTLNMMTLDNYRPGWSTLGLSDQFARHLGFFMKGSFGKFQYQVSINEAITNTLDERDILSNETIYQGRKLLGSRDAGKTYGGYFVYNLLDTESNFLPYKTGTYNGGKKLLNIGAGFFLHPNGVVRLDNNLNIQSEDVQHFAIDVFYDHPLGENGAALTAYALAQHNDYGTDFNFGPYSTGMMYYGHVGYLIPGDIKGAKFQPYISYGNHDLDFNSLSKTNIGGGFNLFFNGHNAKITVGYQNETFMNSTDHQLTLQTMLYL
ncbi:hypothetical protein [Brumimicrobium mesophilum]|uniref:hypothetical protein n=1 Tax=Brumimicrobium mesophilum TaxID=392717 RepID=UPI000D140B75|nr:hypothetical protein [Brumimicrobium mesophilum]